MRNRAEIIQDQKAFGAGGGNSLVLEVLMDIRFILTEQKDLLNILIRLTNKKPKEVVKKEEPKKGYFEKLKERVSDGKE